VLKISPRSFFCIAPLFCLAPASYADVSISGVVQVEIVNSSGQMNFANFDSLSGAVNGFMNIVPGLGAYAVSFSNYGSMTVAGFNQLGTVSASIFSSSTSASNLQIDSSFYGFGTVGVNVGSSALDTGLSFGSSGYLPSSSPASAFAYGNATFATFDTFVGMSTQNVVYDYSEIKSKGSLYPTIGLHWEDSFGNELTPVYTTSTTNGDVITTIGLVDSNGDAYSSSTSGGAILTFAESESVFGYLANLTSSQVRAISADGSLYMVHSNLKNADYLATPFQDTKVIITDADNSVSFVDMSDDGSVFAAYDVSNSSVPELNMSNALSSYSVDGSGLLVTDSGAITNLGNVYDASNCADPNVTIHCLIYSLDAAPTAISGDGSTVVGDAYLVDKYKLSIGDLSAALRSSAFVWDAANGIRQLHPSLAFASTANAVSYNGEVVVGSIDNANGTEAFRWTSAGLVGLSDLAGGRFYSTAMDVSNNGLTVAGFGDVGAFSGNPLFEAFRWTSASGMVGLGRPSSTESSVGIAISGDGSTIVGTMGDLSTKDVDAFRWTQSTGMQTVKDWLVATGVNVPSDYRLSAATVVNNDGSVVGGTSAGAAWVAFSGRGVIYPDTYSATLATPSALSEFNLDLTSVSLEGAHHRPLKAMSLVGDECFWANADASDKSSVSSKTKLAEVGICSDVNENLRAGIGVGKSKTDQSLINTLNLNLNGNYLYGELGYLMANQKTLMSLSLMHGNWDSELERFYANAGSYDSSIGNPDVTSTALKLRLDWMNALEFEGFNVSPSVSLTRSKVTVDEYTEVGGGFPAYIAQQEQFITDLRFGVTAEKQIDSQKTLRFMADYFTEESRSSNGVSGNVIGWQDFSSDNVQSQKDRKRLSSEIDFKLDKDLTMSTLLSFSSVGDELANLLAVSFKLGLH